MQKLESVPQPSSFRPPSSACLANSVASENFNKLASNFDQLRKKDNNYCMLKRMFCSWTHMNMLILKACSKSGTLRAEFKSATSRRGRLAISSTRRLTLSEYVFGSLSGVGGAGPVVGSESRAAGATVSDATAAACCDWNLWMQSPIHFWPLGCLKHKFFVFENFWWNS